MAYEEGLGACWTAFNPEPVAEMLEVPEDRAPLYVMNLGYPAESREAGGQRPRPPFEELYFEGRYGITRKTVVKEAIKVALLLPSTSS